VKSGTRPLAGKRAVVTRAREQAGELIARLEDLGAEVILVPMVSFADPDDTVILDASLRSLDKIDWIVLTSQNAVKYFVRRANALGVSVREGEQMTKIAAVGPATADAIRAEGARVDYIAARRGGEGLVAELRNELSGKRILLPQSDLAKDDLARALREHAAQVIPVIAYKTVAPGFAKTAPVGRIRGKEEPADSATEALEKIQSGSVDVITFASPSSFHNFCEVMGPETMRILSTSAAFAAIGPTTARAIREENFAVAIEASESTSGGLADAIAAHYEKESSGVKTS